MSNPATATDTAATPRPSKRENVMLAFQTPILARYWTDSDDFHGELREMALAGERARPGLRGNVSGDAWQSPPYLFQAESPIVTTLRQRVMEGVAEITGAVCSSADSFQADARIVGWTNVFRNGGYSTVQSHPDATWTGLYYVNLGTRTTTAPPEAGQVEFLDPRPAAIPGRLPGNPFGAQLRIGPKAGTLLLFPGWMVHWTHPFAGTGERISVGVNVMMQFRRAATDKAPAEPADVEAVTPAFPTNGSGAGHS